MNYISNIFVIFIILGCFIVPAYIAEWITWKLSNEEKPDAFLKYVFIIFTLSIILFLTIES